MSQLYMLDTEMASYLLVTNDKALQQVPDLMGVENWATDL